MFSFGVLLWELVTLEPPRRGNLRELEVPKECPVEVRRSCSDAARNLRCHLRHTLMIKGLAVEPVPWEPPMSRQYRQKQSNVIACALIMNRLASAGGAPDRALHPSRPRQAARHVGRPGHASQSAHRPTRAQSTQRLIVHTR